MLLQFWRQVGIFLFMHSQFRRRSEFFFFDLQFFGAHGFVMSLSSCLNKDTIVAALCVSTSQLIIMGSGKECGVEKNP